MKPIAMDSLRIVFQFANPDRSELLRHDMFDGIFSAIQTAIDFFIFAASGTSDFAYHAFKAQIMAMAQDSDGMFKFANDETDGNLPFGREKVMNIIRWRVMSTRIMDYDFSGMHSEIKIQEEKGDDLC